nr:hypothetical protein [Tanacetum cinerariifolium]
LGSVWALRYRELVPGLQGLLRLPAESKFAPQPAPAYNRLGAAGPVLVLGPDRRPYLTHPAARPYLDWSLAEDDFGHLNEYAAVVRIAASLQDQPPAYVIDQRGLMPSLRYLLPGVFGRYEANGDSNDNLGRDIGRRDDGRDDENDHNGVLAAGLHEAPQLPEQVGKRHADARDKRGADVHGQLPTHLAVLNNEVDLVVAGIRRAHQRAQLAEHAVG